MTTSGRHVAIGVFVLMVGAVLVVLSISPQSALSGNSKPADFEIVEYGRLEIERVRLPTDRDVVFRLGMEDWHSKRLSFLGARQWRLRYRAIAFSRPAVSGRSPSGLIATNDSSRRVAPARSFCAMRKSPDAASARME